MDSIRNLQGRKEDRRPCSDFSLQSRRDTEGGLEDFEGVVGHVRPAATTMIVGARLVDKDYEGGDRNRCCHLKVDRVSTTRFQTRRNYRASYKCFYYNCKGGARHKYSHE